MSLVASLAMRWSARGEKIMQWTNWASEHSEALREYLAKSMSFSEIAKAINVRFKTAYSRNAAISRAKRMGLGGDRPQVSLKHWPKAAPKAQQPWLHKPGERRLPEFMRRVPIFERTETARLRCVETDPRHLSLIDLEPGDCRYPYGGDEEGEAITFCGHPRHQGSSYCVPHFHLTRGPGSVSERLPEMLVTRMKRLPRRHRIAHLSALIRHQASRSQRYEDLVTVLRDETRIWG
jgi:GcrA cell cycle regulator